MRAFASRAPLIIIIIALVPSIARAETRSVGAIRWDGWVAGSGAGWGDGIGRDLETVLGPSRFHHRLPFYASEPTATSVTARATTQETIDQEIAYAKLAGLDYWAFDWYRPGSGLDLARSFYLSSAHRADIRWCVILGTDAFEWDADASWLVQRFAEPSYQTVLGGRPLVYVFPEPKFLPTRAQLDSLRAKAAAAGVAVPYIVVMEWHADSASATAAALGADAISAYVTPMTGAKPYGSLRDFESRSWDAWAATGRKVIPWVTTGWDPRPFHETPEPWYPSVAADGYVESATPIEIRAQLQRALAWSDASAAAEARSVLIYAWNEFAEGGWICPTLHHGTDRLLAVRAALDATTDLARLPVRRNLAAKKPWACASSSSWDASMSASRAFDSDPSTCWQAAAGTDFAAQWLEVDLGVNQTFDACAISEYGDRTSGFRIDAWDGLAWRTAYTGTSLGAAAQIRFPRVTGSKVRLVFTRGVYTPIILEMEVLALGTRASSSDWDATMAAGAAFDGDPSTCWQAGAGTSFAAQWLEVDFGGPTSFDACAISEYGDRTSGWVLEWWDGASWREAVRGATIGASARASFPRVTAERARLRFTAGNYTPIIFALEINASSR